MDKKVEQKCMNPKCIDGVIGTGNLIGKTLTYKVCPDCNGTGKIEPKPIDKEQKVKIITDILFEFAKQYKCRKENWFSMGDDTKERADKAVKQILELDKEQRDEYLTVEMLCPYCRGEDYYKLKIGLNELYCNELSARKCGCGKSFTVFLDIKMLADNPKG